MDVKSVTSSVSAYTSGATQTSQAQQTQAVENREPKATDRRETAEEKPRPVVNTDGQKTGTLINVTA
jgi:hypothetical protein